jgi:hypothetical protein
MITSTFLTLLVVPVAYGGVVGFLDRVGERGAARRAARQARQPADQPTVASESQLAAVGEGGGQ